MVLPEGYTYGTFTYDTEGEPTSYQLTKAFCDSGSLVVNCDPGATSFIYGARGELLSTTVPGSTAFNQQSADGFLCAPLSGGCTSSFDARNNMILNNSGVTYTYDTQGWQTQLQDGGTVTRGYDGDSHLISQNNSSSTGFSCSGGLQLGCDPNTNQVDRGSGVSYVWGTNGHPVELTTTGVPSRSTSWEHWDPTLGQILFETGAQTDIAVGQLGVSNATNGVTVEDRDPFGNLSATHTGNEFSVWTSAPAGHPIGKLGIIYGAGTGSNYQGTDSQMMSRILAASRNDSFIDSTYGVDFQGVRTADVNTTQWMTPDAFGGYASDPMSQQPYLWNNNNGLMYSDPSGFCGATVTSPAQHVTAGSICPPQTDTGLGGEGFTDMFGAIGWMGPDEVLVLPHSTLEKIACPSGNYDVAVYEGSVSEGAAVGLSVAVTAFGDVFVSPQAGAGGGLTVLSFSVMQGNFVGVNPGSASRSQINGVVSGLSFNTSGSFGFGYGTMINENGQINLTGAGWPSGFLGASWGYPQPKLHRNCYRH